MVPIYLFVIPAHCGNKYLRKAVCVLHEIGSVKHECTSPRLTMQDGKHMGQSQNPSRHHAQSAG